MQSVNGWIRIKKSNPPPFNECKVCGKPDHCLALEDGSKAICTRISQGGKKVGTQDAGWLHKLLENPNRPKYHKPVEKFKPEKIPNWPKLVKQCQINLPDLSELSKELGLSMESLARLNVGYFRKCFTFPMRNGQNEYVGIRMRAKTKKFAIKGGKNGIFWPIGVFAESREILFICEGPTDTAALLDLGFEAIGRASCNTGKNYIIEMIENKDRAVVIMGDKDEAKYRPDGTVYYPGQEGALQLAQDLKEHVQHIRIIKPPKAKDCRAWVQSGATAKMVMTLVDNARFI